MIVEMVKEVFPGILIAIGSASIFWITTKLKKILKLMNQIPEIKKDIKEMKTLSMYQFKRLDAQDNATTQLFQALKNGRVNGEAASAITVMCSAKNDSDNYINTLIFN